MKSTHWLFLTCALVAAVPASAQTYISSRQQGVPYPALTTATPVTLVAANGLHMDEGRATLPLAFTFPYYNQNFTSITVTANGLAFLTPSSANQQTNGFLSNTIIPNVSEPNGVLAVFWDDLIGDLAGSELRTQALSGPNGAGLAIEWKDWNRRFYSFTLNLQLRLWENGTIEYFYGGNAGTGTISATVGIESPSGGAGVYGLLDLAGLPLCTTSCNLTHFDPMVTGSPITYIKFGPPSGVDLIGPDLGVTAITQGGGNLTLTTRLTMRNFGTLPSGNFTYRLFLSNDTIYDAGDIPLLPSPQGPFTLAPLETVISTVTTTAPSPTSGAWYVLGILDDALQVGETNEFNNIAATVVPYAAGVDLLAQGIAGPPSAGPGDPVTIQIRYSNLGFNSAGPFPVKLWASLDNALSADDSLLETVQRSVTGGAGVTADISFTMPGTVRAGDYTLILQLDDGPLPGVVAESIETNNVAVSAAKMTVQQADLIVDSMELYQPAPPYDPTNVAFFAEPVRMEAVVRNQGGANASNFVLAFYLSDNETLNGLSDPFVGEVTGLTLAPGGSQRVIFTANAPSNGTNMQPLQPGNFFFFAAAIAPGVAESNPSNNFNKSTPVFLRGPASNPVPVDVAGPLTAGVGERFAVSRTLANIGNRPVSQVGYRYYLSANTIITTDDIPLKIVEGTGLVDERAVDLAVGERQTATEVVEVPITALPAPYYLGVLVDPQNLIDETDETDNGRAGARVDLSGLSLALSGASLPDAVLDLAYAYTFTASGGDGTYVFSVKNPSELPPGLTVSPGGLLSGTPTGPGPYAFTIVVTSEGRTTEARRTLRVIEGTATLAISTPRLPAPARLLAYDTQLGAQGGTAPYQWSIVGGQLTLGLSLSSEGRIFGTPNTALGATSTVTFEVRDAVGNFDRKTFTLTVVDASVFQVVSQALPDGIIGAEYVVDVLAQNASGAPASLPVSWTIIGGALPDGLVLEPSTTDRIILSGTPTRAGLSSFTIEAVDGQGRSDFETFYLLVTSTAARFLGAVPEEVLRGDEVSLALSTAPALPGAKFMVLNGALPPGLTLAEDGTLSGTVDADAPYAISTFTVGVGASRLQVLTARGYGIAVVEKYTPKRTGCGCTGVEGSAASVWGLLALAAVSLRRRRRARKSA